MKTIWQKKNWILLCFCIVCGIRERKVVNLMFVLWFTGYSLSWHLYCMTTHQRERCINFPFSIILFNDFIMFVHVSLYDSVCVRRMFVCWRVHINCGFIHCLTHMYSLCSYLYCQFIIPYIVRFRYVLTILIKSIQTLTKSILNLFISFPHVLLDL